MRRSKPESLDAAACEGAALALLARREHSRLELERKLGARGYPDDVIAATLDELERQGAVAVVRFTDTFVRSRAAKGQGPVRIRSELAQRGIAEPDAAASLRQSEVDWAAAARAVRAKRFGAPVPRDFKERARQARFLQYRGFDSRQISAALGGADADD